MVLGCGRWDLADESVSVSVTFSFNMPHPFQYPPLVPPPFILSAISLPFQHKLFSPTGKAPKFSQPTMTRLRYLSHAGLISIDDVPSRLNQSHYCHAVYIKLEPSPPPSSSSSPQRGHPSTREKGSKEPGKAGARASNASASHLCLSPFGRDS